MSVFKRILMGRGIFKKAPRIVLSLLLGLTPLANAEAKTLTSLSELLRETALKTIQEKKIYAKVDLETIAQSNEQRLDYYLAGTTPRSCKIILRKLSLYEQYPKFLPAVIKEARYEESSQNIFFLLDHPLLPHTFTLTFKLPRIEGPGHYPFSFDFGIFSGLTGQINVYDLSEKNQGQCLFETVAKWQGPSTNYPDSIIEFFSEALSKLSMEKLFRISQF